MLALPVSMLLQFVTEHHQDRQQIFGSTRERKIEVGVGQGGTSVWQRALLEAQVVDESTLATASWCNEGQDWKKGPGLVGITAADRGQRGPALRAGP